MSDTERLHAAERLSAKDELRDRTALARRWLRLALDEPAICSQQVKADAPDVEDALARALQRHWVEATRTIPLDVLGRYLDAAGRDVRPAPTAWLSREAVRAVYLVRELRRAGVVV